MGFLYKVDFEKHIIFMFLGEKTNFGDTSFSRGSNALWREQGLRRV